MLSIHVEEFAKYLDVGFYSGFKYMHAFIYMRSGFDHG